MGEFFYFFWGEYRGGFLVAVVDATNKKLFLNSLWLLSPISAENSKPKIGRGGVDVWHDIFAQVF